MAGEAPSEPSRDAWEVVRTMSALVFLIAALATGGLERGEVAFRPTAAEVAVAERSRLETAIVACECEWRPYKALWVAPGRTKAALAAPFDPLTYAHRLEGKRLFMTAGNDEVIPPAARAPWEAAGRPRSARATAAIARPSAASHPPSTRLSNSSPLIAPIDGPGP